MPICGAAPGWRMGKLRGYAPLLSAEAIEKLERDHNWTRPGPIHKQFVSKFDDPGWSFSPAPRPTPKPEPVDDFPIRSTEARAYSKLEALCEAQNHRCGYCGCQTWSFNTGGRPRGFHQDQIATIDHVIPQAAKGPRRWSNEIIACQLCNQGRGAMRAERYFEKVRAVGRRIAAQWGRDQQREASKKRIRVLY